MIHNPNLTFKESLNTCAKSSIEYVVLCHTEVLTRHKVEDVHQWHLKKDWAGIGYHFFVSKEGEIYKGRPLGSEGAHTRGYNNKSVCVAFEGDFNKEKMSDKQEDASVMLIALLSLAYADAKVVCHHDLYKETVAYFPSASIIQKVNACKNAFISLYGKPMVNNKGDFDYSKLLDMV